MLLRSVVLVHALILGGFAWGAAWVTGGTLHAAASAPRDVRPTVERVADRGASPTSQTPTSRVETAGRGPRERIIREASSLVGTREEGGNNRGRVVDKIIASAGFAPDSAIPWCGAFNRYVFDRAGLASVGPQGQRSAWSPAWVAGATWTRERGGQTPLPGDTFGVWFSRLNRVGHTGIIERWGQEVVVTIEGNTGPDIAGGVNRDGDGVHRKRRQVRQIHSVRSWL